MYALLFALLLLIIIPIGLVGYQGTPFEVSIRRARFGGIWIFRDAFLLTGVGVVLLNAYGPNAFFGYAHTSSESVPSISAYIILSIFVFFVSSTLCMRLVSRGFARREFCQTASANCGKLNRDVRRVAFGAIGVGFSITLAAIFVFGAKHALFSFVTGDEYASVRNLRLANTYDTGMPSIFSSLIKFCYLTAATVLGTKAFDGKKGAFLFTASLVVYLASFSGSKASILNCLIVFNLSFITFHAKSLNLRFVGRICVLAIFIAIILVFVIRLQFPGMTFSMMGSYLVNRLGVGQVAGLYEALNLQIHSWNYGLHAVPFVNYFTETPSFQKDLMLVSEGVLDASSTGVKSSLFLSEAYGIGGAPLALFSPLIMGVNYSLSYAFFCYFWDRVFWQDMRISVPVTSLLFTFYLPLTGDFSSWLFFKGAILIVILTSILCMAVIVIRTLGGGSGHWKRRRVFNDCSLQWLAEENEGVPDN